MQSNEVSNLKEVFKQAAEIAQEVPDSMQEIAFSRALSLLTQESVDSGGTASKATQSVGGKVSKKRKIKKKSAGKTKAKAKTVKSERFDIHKSKDKPSLEEFLAEKKPGKNTGIIIVTIGYYITHILEQPSFSDGNIEYAYRTLGIRPRPKYLRQAIIDGKNKKDFFEAVDNNCWKLSRNGEIFVDEKLPSHE